MSFSHSLLSSTPSALATPISAGSFRPVTISSSYPAAARDYGSMRSGNTVVYERNSNICQKLCGLKLWILKNLNLRQGCGSIRLVNEFKMVSNHDKDYPKSHSKHIQLKDDQIPQIKPVTSSDRGSSQATRGEALPQDSKKKIDSAIHSLPMAQTQPLKTLKDSQRGASLCIVVIGATGELARRKIFPALFALYYSGYLPEDVAIFGFSRKNMTDEDLRSIIASTLTCRIDHQENCADKMDAFLSKTYYINGGCDINSGMLRLNERMKQIKNGSEANRIFYLSVPQEALKDVAGSLSKNVQAPRGWTRIIVEKPFGFDAQSSHELTKSLLSNFEEKQIYRIDHMLGRNLIENLTVLRFSNLVFEPLWSRTYIHNVQIIVSESIAQTEKYPDGYGVIRDIVHSHILQTIALLAMEPPISLNGEDIRNEKVKLLRSIRKVDPRDIILGQYKTCSGDKVDLSLNGLNPTYCAASLYIDNARWDGVPFMVRVGTGLINHRVEIRMQFRHVPGNLYREPLGLNIDLGTNELILRDEPDEAILVKVNNKIPGLSLHLDTSELNLLYKDRYNAEVPDSYEHLILDVIDGDNHLFMRSDEVAAAWNILNPVLEEIDKNKMAPELYEFGGRGPVGAYYLWAKHDVPWGDS